MGILKILSRNAAEGSRTRRPFDDVPIPEGFRGMLAHQSARCTACGTCVYVCSPTAIAVREVGGSGALWEFSGGKCTFCGRCVEYCPTRALGFEVGIPGVTTDPAKYRLGHEVPYRPCPRCGKPVVPMPLPALGRLYGDPAPDVLLEQHRLCERCRRRGAAQSLVGRPGARTTL